ncbi:hypothetical protein, partial [Mesorhizobium sp. M2A.F.Ca.ET.042.01.1.1]|uniref:hypothetical protein n=1 Tax=Mesorhizobium sp. M2A.F.Ca.ET.042.01.1.1 TaxID=2496745 RepID=UPI001AEC9E90
AQPLGHSCVVRLEQRTQGDIAEELQQQECKTDRHADDIERHHHQGRPKRPSTLTPRVMRKSTTAPKEAKGTLSVGLSNWAGNPVDENFYS